MKKLLLVLTLFVISVSAIAQKRDQRTPEQRANFVSERMVKKLGITPEQKTKVHDLVLKKATSVKAITTENQADKAQMQAKLKTVNNEFEAELKTILTPEQLTQWTTMKKEWKNKKNGSKGQVLKSEEAEDELGTK